MKKRWKNTIIISMLAASVFMCGNVQAEEMGAEQDMTLESTISEENLSSESGLVRDYSELTLNQPITVNLDGSGSSKWSAYFNAPESAQYEFTVTGPADVDCTLAWKYSYAPAEPTVLGTGVNAVTKYLTGEYPVDLKLTGSTAGSYTITVKVSDYYLHYDRGNIYGLIECEPNLTKTLTVTPSDNTDQYTYKWQEQVDGVWTDLSSTGYVCTLNPPKLGYHNYQCIVTGNKHVAETASFKVYATDLSLRYESDIESRYGANATLSVEPVTSDQQTPIYFQWYEQDAGGWPLLSNVLSTDSTLTVKAEGIKRYICYVNQGNEAGTTQKGAYFTVNGFDLYIDDNTPQNYYYITTKTGQSFTIQSYIKSYNNVTPISYTWTYSKSDESAEEDRAYMSDDEGEAFIKTHFDEPGTYYVFCTAQQGGDKCINDFRVEVEEVTQTQPETPKTPANQNQQSVTPPASPTITSQDTEKTEKAELPNLPKQVKVTGSKAKIKITAKKAGNISGYEIRYKTGKGKWKTIRVSGNKKLNKTIKKLKRRTKYKVQVRTYIDSDNGRRYSKSWSKTVSVKTK